MTDAIIVENLQKRFGSVVALDGVGFTVPTGTVLGLLGPNGAGKTTSVRVLTTILRPDSGRAEVLGLDVTRHAQAVRERIGRAALAPLQARCRGSRGGVARTLQPLRRRRPAGPHLLGWYAASARPRGGVAPPPAGAVPRRADHRSRP